MRDLALLQELMRLIKEGNELGVIAAKIAGKMPTAGN